MRRRVWRKRPSVGKRSLLYFRGRHPFLRHLPKYNGENRYHYQLELFHRKGKTPTEAGYGNDSRDSGVWGFSSGLAVERGGVLACDCVWLSLGDRTETLTDCRNFYRKIRYFSSIILPAAPNINTEASTS